MYLELRVCIDVLGIICVVLGISLFAGTKRETLWDRDNLVGLLLIGIALSTHGGFDTILRSSAHATFSGYDLGWARSSGDAAAPGWISLYDLGYPVPEDRVDYPSFPHRNVYIPANRKIPTAAWNTNKVWLLRVEYRTRDLQAVKIEGRPLPSATASGMSTWSWQSDESLFRPALETMIGIVLMLGSTTLLIKRVSLDASTLHITLVGVDAHR